MKVLEMTDQDIWEVLKILASVLHMGNVRYKTEEGVEMANIPEQANVERVAHLLGIHKHDLIRSSISFADNYFFNYFSSELSQTRLFSSKERR